MWSLAPTSRGNWGLQHGDRHASWDDALEWLSTGSEVLTDVLRDSPHPAFFWECNPVSAATRDRPFEMALVPSPVLSRVRANGGPFSQYIGAGRGTTGVRTFRNLSGDAQLVVPCAATDDDAYPHLAAFVRRAPHEQIRRLWASVAQAVAEHLECSPAPVWVSTSGLGVYWVHIRLDSRPKYYTHAPFKRPPG